MKIQHITMEQEFLPDDTFDVEFCKEVYDKYKFGFFEKVNHDDEFTQEQLEFYGKNLAFYLVGSCFHYWKQYHKSKFITLPWKYKIVKWVFTIYWDSIYDYWNVGRKIQEWIPLYDNTK